MRYVDHGSFSLAILVANGQLQIQGIFDRVPKPFPAAFWRTYGVDTLLGYWLPQPVAKMADEVLEQEVEPYLDEIDKQTEPRQVLRRDHLLGLQVKKWSAKGWIKEDPTAIRSWRKRVRKFCESRVLLRTRLHPFEKLPEEVLVGESRATIRRTFELLQDQLMWKAAPRGTKGVLKKFITGTLALSDLDREFERLAKTAQKHFDKHTGNEDRL